MSTSSQVDRRNSAAHRFDWVAVVLAGLVVFCAAASIVMVEWMPHLDLLEATVLVCWGLSSLITTRPWRGRTAHFVMILYGVIWVIFVAWQDMPDKVYRFTWLDSVRHLIVRLGEHIYLWLEPVLSGGVGRDHTIFLLCLAAGFWLITYVAVWDTIRQYHVWRTIVLSTLSTDKIILNNFLSTIFTDKILIDEYLSTYNNLSNTNLEFMSIIIAI